VGTRMLWFGLLALAASPQLAHAQSAWRGAGNLTASEAVRRFAAENALRLSGYTNALSRAVGPLRFDATAGSNSAYFVAVGVLNNPTDQAYCVKSSGRAFPRIRKRGVDGDGSFRPYSGLDTRAWRIEPHSYLLIYQGAAALKRWANEPFEIALREELSLAIWPAPPADGSRQCRAIPESVVRWSKQPTRGGDLIIRYN
jgi:hypothetical protein